MIVDWGFWTKSRFLQPASLPAITPLNKRDSFGKFHKEPIQNPASSIRHPESSIPIPINHQSQKIFNTKQSSIVNLQSSIFTPPSR
jgi:hypothetical protein